MDTQQPDLQQIFAEQMASNVTKVSLAQKIFEISNSDFRRRVLSYLANRCTGNVSFSRLARGSRIEKTSLTSFNTELEWYFADLQRLELGSIDRRDRAFIWSNFEQAKSAFVQAFEKTNKGQTELAKACTLFIQGHPNFEQVLFLLSQTKSDITKLLDIEQATGVSKHYIEQAIKFLNDAGVGKRLYGERAGVKMDSLEWAARFVWTNREAQKELQTLKYSSSVFNNKRVKDYLRTEIVYRQNEKSSEEQVVTPVRVQVSVEGILCTLTCRDVITAQEFEEVMEELWRRLFKRRACETQ